MASRSETPLRHKEDMALERILRAEFNDPDATKRDVILFIGRFKRNWYSLVFNMVYQKRFCKNQEAAEDLLWQLADDGIIIITDPKNRAGKPSRASRPTTEARIELTGEAERAQREFRRALSLRV